MLLYKRFQLAILFAILSLTPAWAIKIISGPYLQNVGEDQVTIMWRTDTDATAWVEIAPDDKLNFYAEQRPRYYSTDLGRAVIGKVHKVTVGGLKPGTTYRYRIFSEEVLDQKAKHIRYGETASTNVFRKAPLTFRTRNSDSSTLDFVMVNDIHGDNELLTDLTAGVAKGKTDFVLFNGDMVSYMNTEDQVFEGFINTASKLFASETPFYMARGNHETRGFTAKEYMRYFPTPTGRPYYSFRSGPVYFIVLDGGEDKPDNDIEYSRTSFFDDYRREEADWLRGVTQSEEFRNAPFRIVVIHVPPVNSTWHGPLHTKELFLPILNEAGIDLMLCGHLHRHFYNEADTSGANFPILINSNTEAATFHVDNDTLTFTVTDRQGKPRLTKSYPRK